MAPNLRKIFTCLKENAYAKCSNETRAEHAEYFQLRQKIGMTKLYDGTHKTESFNLAADSLLVCLRNNIVLHMYDRIKSFFKAIHPTINSYHTLSEYAV